MAFSGDVLVAGSYHGFNVYRLQDDGVPALLSSVVCPGGQGDVSIVGDLLIMSVEQTRGRVDCGLEGVSEDVSAERFRGIRIFDISDLTRPVQVGAVQTCRGSHTHSVVSGPGEDGKIIVYNSGTSSVREEEELEGCIDESPATSARRCFASTSSKFRSTIRRSRASSTARPSLPIRRRASLAGLWRGGDHGDETQETSQTDQCHDITVFPERKIAAGACSGNGILFDISDPLKPQRIDEVVDKGFAYWHSATFNNDGTKVIFTDEWGGGSRPRCRAYDPLDLGRRCHLRHRRRQARVPRLLQDAGAADRAGELRRAQRLDRAGPGPRHLRPGLVPGRPLGRRFHRLRESGRDRLTSTAARSTPRT